ncbi:unnamed protein product [Mesocestoides corti]|uniref:LRRCT domain-containing protein n=1 Tax=Mesocestoides corti TaxID=53468 RepID=A0A0R3UK39_MESCO|nr:unnamed protein product [Mesocestoides corti]
MMPLIWRHYQTDQAFIGHRQRSLICKAVKQNRAQSVKLQRRRESSGQCEVNRIFQELLSTLHQIAPPSTIAKHLKCLKHKWNYCEVPSCPRAVSGGPAFPYVFLTLCLIALSLSIVIYVYRKGCGGRRSPFLNRLSTIAMAWRKRTSSEPSLLADNVTLNSDLVSGDATQQTV